ncbi:unnamed protein product [Albugo candida]|uniref:HMG box domain-containing protein n=1 Tax=Albugo candida TaxID=65357 RepID=A0A024GV09_9STRA|nr:unnamed protein product [Albugo candida]|eukprot:CCI50565.1 unnamed protein product [Albugo candida]
MKKPQSSYILFSNDQRNLIKQETPGLSIGEIAKITGLKWKALSAEDRERYDALAKSARDDYKKAQEENVEDVSMEEQKACNPDAVVYPLARVKRIVKQNPSIHKISNEALIAISKATELFVEYLGKKSHEQTLYRKRQQIKASDVIQAIHSCSILEWLRDDIEIMKEMDMSEKKLSQNDSSRKTISDFFKGSALAKEVEDQGEEQKTEVAKVLN